MMIIVVLEYCSRQGLDLGGLNVTPPRQAPGGLVRGAGRLRHFRTPPLYPGLALPLSVGPNSARRAGPKGTPSTRMRSQVRLGGLALGIGEIKRIIAKVLVT